MKRIFTHRFFQRAALGCIIFLGAKTAFAQYNLPALYLYRNDVTSAYYNPALLDLKNKRVQIGLLNYHAWGGSNIASYNTFVSTMDGSLSEDERRKNLSNIVDKLGESNLVAGGVSMLPLSVAFRPSADLPLNIMIGVRAQAGGAFQFADKAGQLLYRGNKQFENQTVDFGKNLFARAGVTAEYSLGASYMIELNDDMQLRFGGQLKVLQGFGAFEGKAEYAKLSSSLDKLKTDYSYEFHSAGWEADVTDAEFKTTTGIGFGADLGAALRMNDKIEIGLSVTNLGFVSYSSNAFTYALQDTVSFSGIKLDDVLQKGKNQTFSLDTLTDRFDLKRAKKTTDGFSVSMGPTLMLSGAYEIGDKETDKKDTEYAPHTVFLTYIQGFGSRMNSVAIPFVGAGYTYNLKNIVSFNGSISAGGLNGFAFGLGMGLNTFNSFKLGFGTSNLLSLFGAGKCADASFNLMFAF